MEISKRKLRSMIMLIGLATLFHQFYQSCGNSVVLDGLHSSLKGLKELNPQCSAPVSLAGLLSPSESCYQVSSNEHDTVYQLDKKRMLTPWIPCNSVELVSMASQGEFDFKKAIGWIAEKPRFSIGQIEQALATPEKPLDTVLDHTAYTSPNHKAMVNLIRNAKETLFFNAIIFGGAWGSELIREMMLRKQEAGIEIVILRDTENVFAFAGELVPVWEKMVDSAVATDGFTVIRSDINARSLSAIPFGMEKLTQLFAPFAKEGISLSGRSDHTKILIADGFSKRPSMFVTSKNPSDYNLLNYDESAIVRGPAAAAAQAAFIGDLKQAEALAVKESTKAKRKLISVEDRTLLGRWYQKHEQIAKKQEDGGLVFESAGQAEVRLSENNGDDTVRNTELSVLQLIAGAQRNLRIYNFLTYNPMVAKAVADAVVRLGAENVRIIGDATLTFSLNVTFANMLQDELLKMRKSGGLKSDNVKDILDSVLKWRLTAPPINFPAEPTRIGITQQQHTKSIVVDDQILYLGSTNFDFATLGGAFREFSVSLRDSNAAQGSAAIFDKLWNNLAETVTTDIILSTGGPTKAKTPSNTTVSSTINLIRTEQDRIGALNPRNIVKPEQCN